MKKSILIISSLILCPIVFGQESNFFHATMDSKSAKELEKIFPSEITILRNEDNQSAVFVSEKAAYHLHKNILTHGPGYVYHQNEGSAIAAIYETQNKFEKLLNLTISEEQWVNNAISKVNADNIKTHIGTLEAYGTRRHDNVKGKQAALDLKARWENMILVSGRTDISVQLFNHTSTPMPSVLLKITGSSSPNESVIIGGHLDSISNTNQAPGADDNASGIASITEMLRVLLDINFKPQKNIEMMAFSAEEVGLLGSADVANDYKSKNKNVVAYVQFDMTNYKGSEKDIYLTTDSYNSNALNLFLVELMEHYNKTGNHTFNYGNTICNYGCSDHFSWAQKGYNAAFPFEANFNDANPYIHSSQDKLSASGNNANHAAKFSKLGLEFLIEAAKSSQTLMSVTQATKNNMKVVVENKVLKLIQAPTTIKSLKIIDITSKIVKETSQYSHSIGLENLSNGVYLCVVEDLFGTTTTAKFILK